MEDMVKSFANLGRPVGRGHSSSGPTITRSLKYHLWLSKAHLLTYQERFVQLENADDVPNSTDFVPSIPTYPDSGIKLLEENRVNIATLLAHLNHTITDKFFLCRVIAPPSATLGILLIVEDPEGENAVRLALYNYSDLTGDNLRSLLPVGLILSVMNPLLKVGRDGGLILQCDQPANIIPISEATFATTFPTLSWNGVINSADNEVKAIAAKNSGNKAFIEQKYFDAILFYTNALDLSQDVILKIDLLSNRAATYIKIGCYRVALIDTAAVLEQDSSHMKGIYRHVRALWGLCKYEKGLTFLINKFKTFPHLRKETALSDLVNLGEQLHIHSKTGIYDMVNIIKTCEDDHKNPDIGEFFGYLQITEISGKGFGTVAKKSFKAGELLMCCKAFAYHKPDQDTDATDAKLEITKKIMQKIALENELSQEFRDLFSGAEEDLRPFQKEGDLQTVQEIYRIVTFNSFSPRNLGTTADISGIWTLPAFINHSCSEANASWYIYGDFMFVRAARPISEGDEVLIAYINPDNDFPERTALFREYEFTCTCLLCELQGKEDGSLITERRKQVLESIRRSVQGNYLNPKMAKKIIRNIVELDSLQKVNPKLDVFLMDPVFMGLSTRLVALEMYREALTILEKVAFNIFNPTKYQ